MQRLIRLLLCLAGLVASAAPVFAQAPVASPGTSAGDTKGSIEWPSPDGKFAFRTVYGEYRHTIDLIDNKSQEKLQQIGDEDSSQADWHVRWAPDSSRFALMTRLGHPIQGLDVYVRTAETFQKIDLPDLPEVNIPERLKHGKKFPHFAGLNWQEAEAWKKDGSLVMTIVTMIDGEGRSITGTRTVVLGFDRAGKARIVKSSIKYQTETD
jgi:hypothetical protein